MAKGNIRPGDRADARTIQLCQVGQVQQQLPRAVGKSVLADGCSADRCQRQSSLFPEGPE